MNNQRLRLGLTIGALACLSIPFAGMVGCFSTNATTPNPSGSSGAASGSAGSVANGSGSGSAPDAGTATAGSGSTVGAKGSSGSGSTVAGDGGTVLDDMTGMQSQTGGSWYTYSDRTVPNSEPPQIVASLPGMVLPKEGDSFYPIAASDSRAPTINGSTWPFREAMGNGFSTWGCGFGLDIISEKPDGGPVAVNMCGDGATIFDTSGTDPSVGIPQQFDASAYTGVGFWGTSFNATSPSVAVQLDDKATDLWGGICDPCLNGVPCTGAGANQRCSCSGSFAETVSFPAAGKWQYFEIHWTDKSLKAASWTKQGLTAIDATNLYNLHFQISTSAPKPLPAFDVGVAYITWLTN